MARRHYRVTVEDAFEAHEAALRAFGGRAGVLNLDRIESAVARPYHGYHRPLAAKAGALLQGVGNGHGFVDGNKRTAVILTRLLIHRSKAALLLETSEALEDLMVAVACHEVADEDLVGWFAQRLTRQVQRAG